MDINAGRLVAQIDQVPESQRDAFTPVPKHLQAEAERRLDGRAEVYVSPQEQSRLAAWAAKKRAKSRAKNKTAKRARARNRK